MQRKEISELVNTEDPAWPEILDLIRNAAHPLEILPVDETARKEALLTLQMTTRSALGAVVYETGGMLIDHGWVRILGSGSPRLKRSLPDWNSTEVFDLKIGAPPFLLIADDAVGGFFAVDGGYLGNPMSVFYLEPDTLLWKDLGVVYGQFLVWFITKDISDFYGDIRWKGWQDEIAAMSGDECIDIYPPLWSDEKAPVEKRHRAPVPISEMFELNARQLPKQLGLR